jgi:spore cortex formation protein SpoVR/YcgB (stage V sporulation)
MQNEKNNHLFYYHLPVDRMQQIMSFGWTAVWNGHVYGNTFDLNIVDKIDTLEAEIKSITDGLKENIENSFKILLAHTPSENGPFNFAKFEHNARVKNEGYASYFTKDIKNLINNLSINLSAPLLVRNAAKAYLEAKP